MKKILTFIDRHLSRMEKSGFKLANFTYKASINALLIFMLYTVYSTLREYNDVQKESRKKELYNLRNKKYFDEEYKL